VGSVPVVARTTPVAAPATTTPTAVQNHQVWYQAVSRPFSGSVFSTLFFGGSGTLCLGILTGSTTLASGFFFFTTGTGAITGLGRVWTLRLNGW
jgi:hypothetical protein